MSTGDLGDVSPGPSRTAQPANVQELRQLVGVELGPTAWHDVTQHSIDAFADVTGDHQWIHVDADRAAASQFGGTIAHGLYTLSRGPALMAELLAFDAFAHVINYGYEKVRFPAPLPVGSRLRMSATVRSVDDRGAGTAHFVVTQRFEAEGSDKPTCVAEAAGRVTERVDGD